MKELHSESRTPLQGFRVWRRWIPRPPLRFGLGYDRLPRWGKRGVTAFLVLVCLVVFVAAASGEGGKEPFPEMRGPFYDLVKDGEPVAVVVGADELSTVEAWAVEELRAYVERMSTHGGEDAAAAEPRTDVARTKGAVLPVLHTRQEDQYPIYVGTAARKRLPAFDWAGLGDEGFLLRSTPEGLFVAGGKELGTLYGVYTLLERFGVRWLMPGELGEVVPEARDLRVGTLDETQTPSFKYRWIESGEWALRNKMNISVDVKGKPVGPQWKWSFHTHFYLVSPDEYFEEHPEWFALFNGRRRRPEGKRQQSHQLCTSNPELVEQMAANVIAFFEEKPGIDILSLAPQDGGGFCQCDACRALDEERPDAEAWHARYSNRLAEFNNEVARRVGERYPDKIIKVGAYAMYLRVPLDAEYRPEPNLAVQVCHTYSCNNHPIDSECHRQRVYFRDELEHWAEIANHLFVYEYYRKGMWGNMPFDQVHVIRHDLPYFKRIGVESFFTQPAGRSWPACGLNHYVAAKLAWDVDLDVDRLVADYCEKLFGKAGHAMRRYYEGLMAAFEDYGDCISPYGYKWPTFAAPEIFTPEVVARLNGALSDAEQAAGDETVRARIRPIRARVAYLERVLEYLGALRAPFDGIDLNDEAALAAAHRKAKEIGEPMSGSIKAFCKANGVPSFDRIDTAHTSLRFLVALPGQEPLLR